MSTKAAPKDIKALGFIFEMFKPLVTDEAAFISFVQTVFDDNVSEVKSLIGSTVYDDSAKAADVKRIEIYLAAAELWERKGNLVLKDRVISGETTVNMTESLKSDAYRDRARAIVDRLNGNSGIALSAEESSHFPQDS